MEKNAKPENLKNIFANLPTITAEPRYKVAVLSNREVAPDVILLALEKPAGFNFKAGQYIWLILPERHKIEGIVDRRAYSIASGVESPTIELLIRITESDYLKDVKKLLPNQKVYIIGPMGSEFVPDNNDMVMISGGVGISPFLSILRSDAPGNMSLYAFEDAKRPIYCKDEIEEVSKDKGCQVFIFEGNPEKKHFAGLKTSVPNQRFFISGPQGFVDAVASVLQSLGIKNEAMHFEACYPKDVSVDDLYKSFSLVNSKGDAESTILRAVKGVPQSVIPDWLISVRKLNNNLHFWIIGLIMIAAIVSGAQLYMDGLGVSLSHIFIFAAFFVIILASFMLGDTPFILQSMVAATFMGIFFSRLSSQFSVALEPWILVFPVLARKLSSFRVAMLWDVAYILMIVFTALLGARGLFGVPPFEDSIYQYIFVIVFLSAITGMYLWREEKHAKLLAANVVTQKTLSQQIEEALRLSDMFVKISSQTSNHVILTNKDGQVLYANHAAELLTGYSFSEMRGQTPRLWGGLMNPGLYKKIWTEKSHGSKITYQVINRRRNGSLYIAIARITPIMAGSKVTAYIATEEDVTDLANIDKTKTEFVSLASHQLRTPLSSINWYTEMLMSGDAGKINDQQKKFLDEIYFGSQRMVALVNALLNVSRLEMGTFIVEPVPTDVVALAQSVLDEQQPQIKGRKQKVKAIFSEKIPIMPVDQNLLRMVFQNLLSNAVKYTPVSGVIQLSMEVKGDEILFTVADSGMGIPKQEQGKIFSKLYRATNVREADTDGTGLGLYIVKSVLEQSGGKVWFESDEGKGTTFSVTLPISGMKKKAGTKGLD